MGPGRSEAASVGECHGRRCHGKMTPPWRPDLRHPAPPSPAIADPLSVPIHFPSHVPILPKNNELSPRRSIKSSCTNVSLPSRRTGLEEYRNSSNNKKAITTSSETPINWRAREASAESEGRIKRGGRRYTVNLLCISSGSSSYEDKLRAQAGPSGENN